MTPYLLLDFGTTSTKSSLVDLDTGRLTPPQNHAAIPRLDGPAGHHEVSPAAIQARFEQICLHYRQHREIHFLGIVVCSEMHGFVVLDQQHRPLTAYLGWKDDRCVEPLGGTSTFELVCGRLGANFKRLTGMKPRPGFPLLNLIHLGRTGQLPARGQVVSLPGWLARCSGEPSRLDHPTLLAGMTFYDIGGNRHCDELLELVKELTGFTAMLDEPAPEGQIAGYWHHAGERIPIYVGVGDHQGAVLGAGLTSGDALSINLGTGAQVSILDAEIDADEVETRPFFAGRRLQTITHVPAGRALNEYLGFLDEVAGGRTDFWAQLGRLTANQIQASELEFELGVFPGARGYGNGGRIARIREGRFTVHQYLASLLRCFAGQYIPIAALFDPQHRLRRCLLSGGIARKLPVLGELIAGAAGYETLPATAVDESLLGLRALALHAAGQAASSLEAQHLFDRQCQVEELA